MPFAFVLFAFILPTAPDLTPFHWEGRLAAGQSIEIRNLYGSIHAETATGNRADVTTRQSSAQIAIVETADGIMLRINPNAAHDRTDFVVRVPAGVHFIGRTVNGSVRADSLQSDAAGYTVNGDIHIRATGVVRAKTVNGNIEASAGRLPPGAVELSAVNGGITLQVPRQARATLHASTSHGRINSDLPTAPQAPTDLRLTTVNGDIRVRRYPEN